MYNNQINNPILSEIRRQAAKTNHSHPPSPAPHSPPPGAAEDQL